MPANETPPLLRVENLALELASPAGPHSVLKNVNFSVERGRTLALVGESGCGKSLTMRSVMGLLPATARVTSGRVALGDTSLLKLNSRQLNRVRGRRMAMIFQEPMSALNPTLKIGTQITEVLRCHGKLCRNAAKRRAIELLDSVGISEPAHRIRQYPFELSGGMLQRVTIAIALAGEPELLIADEPTTALDTSVQAQIIDLLASVQQQRGMGIVLVTHDLGVVARLADHVAVMYAGEVVERADVDDLFTQAMHPYTQGLLAATPRLNRSTSARLRAVPGAPPPLGARAAGCSFAPRCQQRMLICNQRQPPPLTVEANQEVSCWRYQHLPSLGSKQAND